MKINIISILFCILTLISITAQSQTAEEIIAKHIKAHGGDKSWDGVTSMELTGRFTAFSEEHDFYALKTNKGEYYSDLNVGQHKVKEAFNGNEGWTIDPWHDFTFPRKLNKAEINVFYQKADFFTPFYKYKEKGCKVEYIGEKKIDGKDTYALKLIRTNGMEEIWYLDNKTYLEYKCESNWVDFAVQLPGETFFDDFRNIEGKLVPFYIERMFGQRSRILELETVNFNADIDRTLFEIPKSDEMKKLAFLEGNWTVKVERMNRRGEMQTVDETVSKGEFKAVNLLRMKLTVDDYYVQPMTMYFSYHKDSEKYRVFVYSDFSSSFEMYEGDFNEGVFFADNTKKYGDYEAKNILQLKISDVSDSGFLMEINSSQDKGQNWMLYYKLTFEK